MTLESLRLCSGDSQMNLQWRLGKKRQRHLGWGNPQRTEERVVSANVCVLCQLLGIERFCSISALRSTRSLGGLGPSLRRDSLGKSWLLLRGSLLFGCFGFGLSSGRHLAFWVDFPVLVLLLAFYILIIRIRCRFRSIAIGFLGSFSLLRVV